jgi:hypothetical protein
MPTLEKEKAMRWDCTGLNWSLKELLSLQNLKEPGVNRPIGELPV